MDAGQGAGLKVEDADLAAVPHRPATEDRVVLANLMNSY